MILAFVCNFGGLDLTIRLPVIQISRRRLGFVLSNPTFLILSSMEVCRKTSVVTRLLNIIRTEYEGAIHDILGQALKRDIKKILTLGLQTVCRLAFGNVIIVLIFSQVVGLSVRTTFRCISHMILTECIVRFRLSSRFEIPVFICGIGGERQATTFCLATFEYF